MLRIERQRPLEMRQRLIRVPVGTADLAGDVMRRRLIRCQLARGHASVPCERQGRLAAGTDVSLRIQRGLREIEVVHPVMRLQPAGFDGRVDGIPVPPGPTLGDAAQPVRPGRARIELHGTVRRRQSLGRLARAQLRLSQQRPGPAVVRLRGDNGRDQRDRFGEAAGPEHDIRTPQLGRNVGHSIRLFFRYAARSS